MFSLGHRPAPSRRAHVARPVRHAAGSLTITLGLLLPGMSVAAPDGHPPPADRVTRFLGEHGLDGATIKSSSLVQQVRDRASELVMSAMHFLGVPYRRGGDTEEDGFDCSGFTRHVFDRSLGLVLPRRADEQARAPGLMKVKRNELQPGDLVFFNTLRRTFSHVGIYVGEGKFIHAPRAGAEVRIEDMHASYWAKRFTGARRAAEALEPQTSAPAAPVPANLTPDNPHSSLVGPRAPRPE
ncbi:MAG: C40 family peptidase [Pseudomonadota bacterium]